MSSRKFGGISTGKLALLRESFARRSLGVRRNLSRRPLLSAHHARQAFSRTMGWFTWQPKAERNSGMFTITPFTL
jgi:hypothetical protein